MELPSHPGIRCLGFVSPEDKNSAMRGALATVHPSYYESLCMAALESMAFQTPIIVQEKTEPLKQHCINGKGGIYYSDYHEFAADLDLLLHDKKLREVLGKNGFGYVKNNYSWSIVLDKYKKMFNNL